MRFKSNNQRKAVMARLRGCYDCGNYSGGKEVPVTSFKVRPKYCYAQTVNYNGEKHNVYGLRYTGKGWLVKLIPQDKNEFSCAGIWVNQNKI